MDKKTLKKQEIIKKSIHVMFEKGYNGTGVKDLTDAAGIPKGSLYNYFVNKEDYAREALYYYYRVMSKKQFDKLDDEKVKPVDRIKNFYAEMIADFDKNESLKFGCFVGNLTQEMGGVSDLLQAATDEIHNEITEKIEKCLSEARAQKTLSLEPDIDVLSKFIVSSWQGALLRTKASQDTKSMEAFYKVLVEVLLK